MNCSIPRPGARARLIPSLVLASAVSLLTVTAASAQSLAPIVTAVPGVPTTRSAISDAPTAPGQPSPMGVPLDQAIVAFRALSGAKGGPAAAPAANQIS